MEQSQLIPLAPHHLPLIRSWRNQYRKYFLDPSFITSKMHQQWHHQYTSNPDTHFYLIHADQPIGTISIHLQDHQAEINNILIAIPKYRRRGYANWALNAIINLHPATTYQLRVLPSNLPAQKLYRQSGFVMIKHTNEFLLFQKKAVPKDTHSPTQS